METDFINTDPCRIARITVRNYGVIKLIDTPMGPGLNLIGGRNESGKSTLVRAIELIANGKRALLPDPVRHGAQKAEIEAVFTHIDGSPAHVVRVTQTAQGSYTLKIFLPSGEEVGQPARVLEILRGAAGPDPVQMAWETDPRKVRDHILRVVGANVEAIDQEERDLSDERRLVGRDVKRLRGAVEEMGRPNANAPKEEISVAALREAHEAACKNTNSARDAEKALTDARAEVARLESLIDAQRGVIRRATDIIDAGTPDDLAPVVEETKSALDRVDEVNAAVRHNNTLAQKEAELLLAETRYNEMTEQIRAVEDRRAQALKDAGLNVEGLDLSTGEAQIDGCSWGAVSKGRRLRTAIQIRAAVRAPLQVAWTQEGDCLDDDNLSLVAKECEQYGLQLILERTGERDAEHGALILENGKAKS